MLAVRRNSARLRSFKPFYPVDDRLHLLAVKTFHVADVKYAE